MTVVLHWVAATPTRISIEMTLPVHHGHNARVTFLAQPLLCTIFIVPRTTIYEVRGDFREPETNPDYYHLATSRSARLEGVAESLLMRKTFDAWSGSAAAKIRSGAARQASKPVQPSGDDDEKEEAILVEEAVASFVPVRDGFRFSSVSSCLPSEFM